MNVGEEKGISLAAYLSRVEKKLRFDNVIFSESGSKVLVSSIRQKRTPVILMFSGRNNFQSLFSVFDALDGYLLRPLPSVYDSTGSYLTCLKFIVRFLTFTE